MVIVVFSVGAHEAEPCTLFLISHYFALAGNYCFRLKLSAECCQHESASSQNDRFGLIDLIF